MSLPFLEKLLQLLGHGGFSATYKYAVLLALIDLCVEAGEPPSVITTPQLARRVVELYWPQVRPWGEQGVLRQNAGSQAKIAALILDYRQLHADQLRPPRRDSDDPAAIRLFREVEWVLVEYPLPRVQRVGGGEERFLYEIGWDDGIQKRAFKAGDFDNRVLLRPEAAASLVNMAAILRPLIQQHWMAMVVSLNHLHENIIQDFLFGSDRAQLHKLRAPLLEIQSATCFYCDQPLVSHAAQVDHFLPWSRHPDDGLDNLVAAHDACNRDKLHFLADLDFAKRWQARNRDLDGALTDLAATVAWPRDPRRTRGIVAAAYLAAPEGIRLWGGRGALRALATPDLPAVHAFGRSLLTP